MHTPWGVARTQQQLDEGVIWVETTNHGGILVEKASACRLLSEKACKIGVSWQDFLAFEQEQDMVVVFYEHPEWYIWAEEDLTGKIAEDLLRQSHPEYFST